MYKYSIVIFYVTVFFPRLIFTTIYLNNYVNRQSTSTPCTRSPTWAKEENFRFCRMSTHTYLDLLNRITLLITRVGLLRSGFALRSASSFFWAQERGAHWFLALRAPAESGFTKLKKQFWTFWNGNFIKLQLAIFCERRLLSLSFSKFPIPRILMMFLTIQYF